MNLYPTLESKYRKIKYKPVQFSPAKEYMERIDMRSEDFYEKMAVYMLILSIRDLLYRGKNKYHCYSRRKAIAWFKSKTEKDPFSYKTICLILGISAERMWLQLKRWLKANPDHLANSLKSAESGIFDGPKFSLLRREGHGARVGEENRD